MCLKRPNLNILLLLFLSLSCGFGMQCFGQKPSYMDSTRWETELPVWVPGFRGAVSFGDVTIESGSDGNSGGGGFFDRIFDSKLGLDYYLVGKIRYTYNKWRIQADVFGGQIEHSTLFKYNGSLVSNTKIEVIIPRLNIAYRVLVYDFKKANSGTFQSYLYAGVKFFYTGVKSVLPDPIPPLDFNSHWADPVLGATLSYLWKGFTFTGQTDFSPLDVFSTPSWWYQLHARYRFGKLISMELGWVRQDFTRTSDLANEHLEIKFRLQGPLAGVTFHF